MSPLLERCRYVPAALLPPLEAPACMYAEPQRVYHGAKHVEQLLDTLHSWAPKLDERERVILELFVLLHDCVYVPGAGDNEARSAEIARSVLTDWCSEETIAAVERAILATRDHVATDHLARIAIDLDLSPLAGSDHPTNAQRIRAEYSMFDDVTFRAGRIAFLTNFLERPHLFLSDFGAPLEAPARANLTRELEALRA